jgi:hypothetical protein
MARSSLSFVIDEGTFSSSIRSSSFLFPTDCSWFASSVGFIFVFVGLGHIGDESIRRSKTRTRLAGDKLGDSF